MRSAIVLWLVTVVGCYLAGCTPLTISTTTAVPSATLVIENGTIFTGTGSTPVEHGILVVDGDRIVAVGQPEAFNLPADVPAIDAGGGTVLPGLINAHVHYTAGPDVRRAFLEAGVTTVCDLGTSLHQLPVFEESYTRDGLPVARGLTTGPILTAVGGYPGNMCPNHWHYEVADVAEAGAAVDDLADQGIDLIKLALESCNPQAPVPMLTSAQVQAIVDAAHARGLIVRAHVRDAALLNTAVEAGVDAIEHVPLPFHLETETATAVAAGRMSLADYPQLQAQFETMIANDIALVPTLAPYVYLIETELRLTSQEQAAVKQLLFDEVRTFVDGGGTVALGNDYGSPGTQLGLPVNEMHLLAEAGLSNAAILQAATQHAARVSGREADLGTLEPGKLADILIVRGNPLTDLSALACPAYVIQGGEVVISCPDGCC